MEALEAQVSDLQNEASRLIRSLDSQKEQFDAERVELSKKVEGLEKEQASKDAEISSFKEKMKQYQDYDELKRELEIMKVSNHLAEAVRSHASLDAQWYIQYVEFAGMDLDDMNDDFDGDGDESLVHLPDPNADKANLQRGKPLENLLMAKNRKMQDEVTALRVAHDELAAAHETVMADYAALQSRYEEQAALNDRLENDLLRINESRHGGQAQSSTANREDPLAGFQLGKKVGSRRSSSSVATSENGRLTSW